MRATAKPLSNCQIHGLAVQDTINVQELRFGDNDTLSAQVAAMIEADWLVLLTDVDYLYTANPAVHPSATPIKVRLRAGSASRWVVCAS